MGKNRELLQRLLREYPHVFGQVVSHTTRKLNTGEEHGIDYYYVSKHEMTALQADGRFVETSTDSGNSFGVSYNAIDRITDEGKICLMDLDVDVISFYMSCV